MSSHRELDEQFATAVELDDARDDRDDRLLEELERCRTAGVSPGAAPSRLWMRAGPELRRQVGVGLVDAETFWLKLRVWIEGTRA